MAAYFCRMNYRVAHPATTDSYRDGMGFYLNAPTSENISGCSEEAVAFKRPVLSCLRNVELLP